MNLNFVHSGPSGTKKAIGRWLDGNDLLYNAIRSSEPSFLLPTHSSQACRLDHCRTVIPVDLETVNSGSHLQRMVVEAEKPSSFRAADERVAWNLGGEPGDSVPLSTRERDLLSGDERRGESDEKSFGLL